MESDQSYSADSNSSSGSSSGSADGEEEALEPVKILGQTLELPQGLLEDYGVFKEFFSLKTWESLEEKHKDHLKNFLPKFNDNDEEEKDKTIKMLFNREPFHFSSPLNDFHSNLRQGNYRPDIAKMKKFLVKAKVKQQRHKVLYCVMVLLCFRIIINYLRFYLKMSKNNNLLFGVVDKILLR